MKPIEAKSELVAACGLYCGACRSYLRDRCPGCRKNTKATWCKIRLCCQERRIESCAECSEYPDPQQCRKFNNLISTKAFALIFRSNRAACIEQIRRLGLAGHAADMAANQRQSIRR